MAETPCQKYMNTAPADKPGLAESQVQALWHLVLEEEYKELPPLNGKERVLNINPAKTFKELMELRIRAFEVRGDIRPVTDSKMTHINGPAALVRLVFYKSPFTGMFSEGEQKALIRTSFAFNPKTKSGPHDFPQPGLAIKLFVDGTESLNILAMGSLDGEGDDGRYFSTAMATKLDMASTTRGKIGEKIFNASTINPGHLRLDHVAGIQSNGVSVKDPVTPEWIVFTPTALAESFGDKRAIDFRPELLGIPQGSRIYTIQGAFPAKDGSFKMIEIGYVETDSRFVASEFADKKLHFRHQGAKPTEDYVDYIRWQCGE
jgi:hypothetical protein